MMTLNQSLHSQSPVLLQNDKPKAPYLYIGGLSPRVTEYMLQEIFAVAGPVVGVKIVPDRNSQQPGSNYGFVEFKDMKSAETALLTLNGRRIFDMEIKCNWAHQNQPSLARGHANGNGANGAPAHASNGAPTDDSLSQYHVFVGDLSAEVNDQVLHQAFSAHGTLTDARVMFDAITGRTRGFGFVAFSRKEDAEQAIAKMNGEWLGSRAIRVNWANQKNSGVQGAANGHGVTGAAGGLSAVAPQSYEAVANSAPILNTTIYVGNLVPYTTQADLIPLFQGFGYIHEIRMQADRGFAFVKLDTHDNATKAIVNLNGQTVRGRQLKCSWGKDRSEIVPLLAAAPTPQFMYAAQQYAQPYGAFLPQPSVHETAAHAAAMAAWQAQYGAQYAAYMQQQAALAQQGRR